MKYLFALAALAYICWALVNAYRRPGLIGAAFLGSYGLAVFFGPLGGGLGLIAILGTLSVWVVSNPRNFVSPPPELFLLLWALSLAASLFVALYPDDTGQILLGLLVLAGGAYIFGRTFGASNDFIDDLVRGCFVVLLICAPAIAFSTTKTGELSVEQNTVGLAVLQEIPVVAVMALLMFKDDLAAWQRRSLWGALIFVIVPFAIVIANRSSVLAAAIVFFFYVVLRIRRGKAFRLILISLGFFALLGVIGVLAVTELKHVAGFNVLSQGVTRLVINIQQAQSGNAFNDPSSRGRLVLYADAIGLIKTAPILGHGVGAFGYLGDYLVLGAYPHNMFLELLLDGGIVGLLLFLGFLVPIGLFALKRAWKKDADWRTVFLAGLLLEALIRHQVSMTITAGKMLFFVIGILMAQWAGEIRQKRLSQQAELAATTA